MRREKKKKEEEKEYKYKFAGTRSNLKPNFYASEAKTTTSVLNEIHGLRFLIRRVTTRRRPRRPISDTK